MCDELFITHSGLLQVLSFKKTTTTELFLHGERVKQLLVSFSLSIYIKHMFWVHKWNVSMRRFFFAPKTLCYYRQL